MSTTKDTPPTAPAAGSEPSHRAKLERLLVACDGLMNVVEGCLGKRWSCDGTRLVDTKEWCEFFVAQRAVHAAAHTRPVEHAKGTVGRPQLPAGMSRDDAVLALRELRNLATAAQADADPGFQRWPDLDALIEHIAEHGLSPNPNPSDGAHD